QVRINYGLVDASTRRQLRADTVVADAADVFTLQDQTVQGLVAMLDLAVHPQDRVELADHGTAIGSAYESYLRGVGYLQGYDDPKNVASAIDAFQRAAASDPNYGLAYAGLGQAYWLNYQITYQAEFVESARQMCQKALQLSPQLAQAHVCLGTLANGTGNYSEAIREFSRAVELDRNDDVAFGGLAQAYQHSGQQHEAEVTYLRAIEARPQYWSGYARLAGFYVEQARYAEAVHQYSLAAERAPANG